MEEILTDPAFQQFLLKKPNLKKATAYNYAIAIKYFVEANNLPFNQMVKNVRAEQNDRIENNVIIKYDPDYGIINDYIYTFVRHMKVERENSNNSVKAFLTRIKIVFSALKIQLPTLPDFKDDTQEWYLLTKEDIKCVLDASTVHHKALITFLAVTGLRISDALSLTINDFMLATQEYHEFSDVNEFIDNAPSGMIGFWNFNPSKTQRHKIICKVCNTPEASDYILLSLRKRKKFFIDKSRKEDKLIEISKDDPLFASRSYTFKKSLTPHGIVFMFKDKNKYLKKERERILKQKLDEEKINLRTYEKLIEEYPKFHAHGLRKFFISTLATNCGDLRLCATMEGHASPLKNDSSYNKVSDNDIKESYFKVIPDLSFKNVKVDFLVSREKEKLLKEVEMLNIYLDNLKKERDELKDIPTTVFNVLNDMAESGELNKMFDNSK